MTKQPADSTEEEGQAATAGMARLAELRDRIIELDREIVRVIGERRSIVLEVGQIKGSLGLPVVDPPREAEVVRRAATIARELGVDEELTRDVIWRIIASARELQKGQKSWGPPARPTWSREKAEGAETAEGTETAEDTADT